MTEASGPDGYEKKDIVAAIGYTVEISDVS